MKHQQTPPRGHALWVLLDLDVLLRADPNETAPGTYESLVALVDRRSPIL